MPRILPAALSLGLLLGCSLAAATRAADDPPAITKKDISKSVNNLKQIGLAFHNYHDTYGYLPIDIADKDGKPLLSWRVGILPFIEETKLYNAFKQDEAWDGPTNKKLIEKMPKIYAPIRVKAKDGETFYQVFTGTDAIFGPTKKPKIIAITDGTSNTGMVFEAGDPVIWSKPADMAFDAKKALPKLGGMFDGECNVVLCDGSVRRLKKDPDEKQLKYFIMPYDGNVLDPKKIFE